MRRSLITTILTALLALILVSAANAAVPNGTGNGSAPLVRVTYHYVS
jgi:hypothetical protein